MKQQLSLSARPRTFRALVGQQEIVDGIRGQMRSKRVQSAYLFTGPRGSGKTTIAKIMALSLQCRHQTEFGLPCRECRMNRSSFDIMEINAAKIRGVNELEQALEGTEYAPRIGDYRVYIIDECHRCSDVAQDLLLKYLEESPKSTIYILCSTSPHRIVSTLQSRCQLYQLKELELDDIQILIEKLLKIAASGLPADRLAEALVDKGIGAPRLIANAVEKYVAGMTPERAAAVEVATAIDVRPLTRAVIKGNWAEAAEYLARVQGADIDSVRLGMVAYLRTLLLRSNEISGRTEALAKSITSLCELQRAEDVIRSGGLAAALYRVTAYFSRYAVG